jgi:hypothetical protein
MNRGSERSDSWVEGNCIIIPMPEEVQSKEIAFYYPGPMWHHDDWIKTMILFFDGIGILLPDYLRGKPEAQDPAIAIPLLDQGLLHVLEPEQIVDKAATEKLSAAMTEIINSGALDKLDKNGEFHEISYSRMGGFGEETLARQLFESLKEKGLARDSEDGKSIPMQPMVRSLILVLLSQILRPHGEKLGAELSPATDRPQLVHALQELLSLPDMPSAPHVVALDLETISVDLRLIPMDEVLGFRKENLTEYRRYIRGVHRLARELAALPAQAREEELADRREELQELANKIKTTSRKVWKQPASFGLGITGAFWKLAGHDYVGALFGVAGAVVGLKKTESPDTGAYSYLFRASNRFY